MNHSRTRHHDVILTLEGVLRRIPGGGPSVGDLICADYFWGERWRTPDGRAVTGTIALAMRDDYVAAITKEYRRLEYGKE
jgi:hypothetical protein